jgi:hypothetical protein
MTQVDAQGTAGAVWRDKQALTEALRANGWSNRETARSLGCGETVIRSWRKKHGIGGPKSRGGGNAQDAKAEKPGFEVDGDSARIVTEAGVELGDVETLIRDRGLNPADWDVERVKVNEWESYAGRDEPFGNPETVTLRQLTVHLRRRKTWDFLLPATPLQRGRVFQTPKRQPRGRNTPWLEWVGGDQQWPYADEQLHRAVCRWLNDLQPDGMSLTGDSLDFPTISRHDDRPHWNATPQECVDAAYRGLLEYREAAPDARIRKLRGNHDWRIESEMLKRAERLFGLRPARLDDEDEPLPLYSVIRLLRLDELAVDLCGVEGDKWEFGEIELADDVIVRHRPPSQMKVARLNRSVVAGDSHRQAIQHVTQFVAGEPVVRTLMQVGTLAQARGGLGYAVDADWQQGFGTVALFPDGTRAFDLARWDGRALTWRGQTWKP